MLKELVRTELINIVDSILSDFSVSLIECQMSKRGSYHKIYIVVYISTAASVSMEDLHRCILARLYCFYMNKKVVLSISTPGIQRILRYVHELCIFSGHKVKIWYQFGVDYLNGILLYQEDGIFLKKMNDERLKLNLNDIRKIVLSA